MFEDVSARWKSYLEMVAPSWDDDDPRHGLGAEIAIRLDQLNLILKQLQGSIDLVKPTSAEVAYTQALYVQFRDGEIDGAEYEKAIVSRPRDLDRERAQVEAWKLITLYTETFYFVGWRLRQAIKLGPKPLQFPGVDKVKAEGIRTVRNHLIEHPEKHEQNYLQGTIVTDSGPVLRTSTVTLSGTTGRTRPEDESKDRGLFENATAFRDDLLTCIDRAIARMAAKTS